MTSERNTETRQALQRDIKALQSRCVDACNIIENAPPEAVLPENVLEKTLCYVEGVRAEIQNSNTPVTTDDNLLTSQFLNEIKEKTVQVKELLAFTRGAIRDTDAEINRLKYQLKIVQEAKSRPRSDKQEVQPEHMQRARERFHLMKQELHGLIRSLFPDKSEDMLKVLASLMSNHLAGTADGYIEIASKNYRLIELLKGCNIVSTNPYNDMEVKLAY